MRYYPANEKYTKMLSRDGSMEGRIINLHSYPCHLEGCHSDRISVRWPDNSITYPCAAGTKEIDEYTLQII